MRYTKSSKNFDPWQENRQHAYPTVIWTAFEEETKLKLHNKLCKDNKGKQKETKYQAWGEIEEVDDREGIYENPLYILYIPEFFCDCCGAFLQSNICILLCWFSMKENNVKISKGIATTTTTTTTKRMKKILS